MKAPHALSVGALSGQAAIVTGATKGIGRAVTLRLAEVGANLVLNARTQEALEMFSSELSGRFPDIRVETVPGNIGKPEIAEVLVDRSVTTFGRLDILINNAGIAGKIALLQEISIEEIDATIDTNLKGPLYLMKYAIPVMVSQNAGTIINMNSVAGKTAFPFWSVYDASKFGLRAATEAVGEEQRSNNIRIIGIYPGAVDTPIWESIELNHEPNKNAMLSAETIADAVLYVLQHPQQIHIRELTLSHLTPAL